MVGTLIVFLLIIIFLAFFVGKNLLNICTIWFFKTYVDIPVAMLVFISFGAGIVFSLVLLLVAKIRKNSTKAEDEADSDKKSKINRNTEQKIKLLKEKKSVKFSKKDKKGSTNKENTSVVESESQTEDVIPTEKN